MEEASDTQKCLVRKRILEWGQRERSGGNKGEIKSIVNNLNNLQTKMTKMEEEPSLEREVWRSIVTIGKIKTR